MVSQSPNGGTAAPGSTVTITVSGGAVPVPSVVGDSQQTANQILTTAGFAVTVQQGSGPAQYANGTVFSQQPGGQQHGAEGHHHHHLRPERGVAVAVAVGVAVTHPEPHRQRRGPPGLLISAPGTTTAGSGYA